MLDLKHLPFSFVDIVPGFTVEDDGRDVNGLVHQDKGLNGLYSSDHFLTFSKTAYQTSYGFVLSINEMNKSKY